MKITLNINAICVLAVRKLPFKLSMLKYTNLMIAALTGASVLLKCLLDLCNDSVVFLLLVLFLFFFCPHLLNNKTFARLGFLDDHV